MDRKMDVTAADLFVLLDREFRRRKSRDCAGCIVQLPFRVRGADWEAIAPGNCARGCTAVFEEIVREFQRLYALKEPNESERT